MHLRTDSYVNLFLYYFYIRKSHPMLYLIVEVYFCLYLH